MNYNYYDLLNVQPNASEEEIRIAYTALVKLYESDTSQIPNAAQMYRLISDAYEILTDSTKRERFDFELNRSRKNEANGPIVQDTTPLDKPIHSPKKKAPISKLTLDKSNSSEIVASSNVLPEQSNTTKKSHSAISLTKIAIFILTILLRIIYEPIELLSPLLNFLLKWAGRLGLLMSILATLGFATQPINYGSNPHISPLIGLIVFYSISIICLILGHGGLDGLLDQLESFICFINGKKKSKSVPYQPERSNHETRNANSRPKNTNICPLCNSRLVKRKGKYGAFHGCSRYPRCTYTRNIC